MHGDVAVADDGCQMPGYMNGSVEKKLHSCLFMLLPGLLEKENKMHIIKYK